MAAIHVRDVPEQVLEALKRRAEVHHRSLQGELLQILEQAAASAPLGRDPGPLRLTLAEGAGDGTWSRQEIYGDDGR